jgi:hypothetical protein
MQCRVVKIVPENWRKLISDRFYCMRNLKLKNIVTKIVEIQVIATVGGGTGLGTAKDYLELLGCYGTGKARKFAEIIASVLLAGEISMWGAIVSGEFSQAHDRYGRSRPRDDSGKLILFLITLFHPLIHKRKHRTHHKQIDQTSEHP